MRRRYQAVVAALPSLRLRVAPALRDALAEGYGRAQLRSDAMAGLVVGIVALPLSMALAVASGVAPQHGLYTAIVGGAVIGIFGGSRFQVSGPTAAFVVLLAPISATFGLGGLLVATLMAGVLLVAMGVARLGRLIQFIPYPVTTGFTTGIALVIATLQIRDFMGLQVGALPEHYIERFVFLIRSLPTARASDLGVGVFTLAVLVVMPRFTKKVPAPLVALMFGLIVAWLLETFADVSVVTIGTRFSGIPQRPPLPVVPWSFLDAHGQPLGLSLAMFRALAPAAFAIAMLGAIESLLSAVVADGVKGTKHDPDAELVAQGIGNMLVPFFGGIAATGAFARTATNIRAGATSPIAAIVHSLFVLVAVLALAPLLGRLPMASLAALLLIVAWNMAELKHFANMLRVAPKSDVLVLLTCFTLTVLFDMVVAVSAGVMLAALLFMRRMAEVSDVSLVAEGTGSASEPMPRGVLLYEVRGPLFFGAAHKAMSALGSVQRGVEVVVLDLRAVPAIDATGLTNLDSALARIRSMGAYVVIAGVQPQPREAMRRAGWHDDEGQLAIRASFEEGLRLARARVSPGEPSATP